MQVMENSQRENNVVPGREHFLDINTIQQRVAAIKRGWSPEVRRARTIEGKRRREALESLVLDQLTDTSASEESCDLADFGFSLVG